MATAAQFCELESAIRECCEARELVGYGDSMSSNLLSTLLEKLKAVLANVSDAEWADIVARATKFFEAPSALGGFLLLSAVVKAIQSTP